MDDGLDGVTAELYRALMIGEEYRVIEICERIPEGPLHILNRNNDTVLHLAAQSKQRHLAFMLLELLQLKPLPHIMTRQNDFGNTILHEAATSNNQVLAALIMSNMEPSLLDKRNRRGETPLFRAALYGNLKMFKALVFRADEMLESGGKDGAWYNDLLINDDETTILHASILTDHFELAFHIAQRHEHLINEPDGGWMTPLELLAWNPSVIENGIESNNRGSFWESFRRNTNEKYEYAVRLAKLLVAKDKTLNDSVFKIASQGQLGAGEGGQEALQRSSATSARNALFLATKFGTTAIAEEILKLHPQTVEYIDDKGRNILHVAIMYRRIPIIDLVEQMELPMTRLVQQLDNEGNSILHMVGMKEEEVHTDEEMETPALLLQKDLILFERVQKMSRNQFIKHFNKNGKTPIMLLADGSHQLRNDAKEWLKRTAENCSIVSVLIASVAFAAAYTIPGGPNQNTGYPILQNQPFLIVFILTDALCFALAFSSVFTFVSIHTSSFRLINFKESLPQKLNLGIHFLIYSVFMMLLAVGATFMLTFSQQRWVGIVVFSILLIPAIVAPLSYLALMMSLYKRMMSLYKTFRVFARIAGFTQIS